MPRPTTASASNKVRRFDPKKRLASGAPGAKGVIPTSDYGSRTPRESPTPGDGRSAGTDANLKAAEKTLEAGGRAVLSALGRSPPLEGLSASAIFSHCSFDVHFGRESSILH